MFMARTPFFIYFLENPVLHILTGKAYSRALRGHLIVDTALNALSVDELQAKDGESDKLIKKASDVYQNLLTGSITIKEVESNCKVLKLQSKT